MAPLDGSHSDADYQVLTPERVGLQYAIAGIGSRAAAAIIDAIIQVLLVAIPLGALIAIGTRAASSSRGTPSPPRPPASPVGPSGTPTLTPEFWIGIAIVAVLVFLAVFLYFMLFEIFWNGQTPGKRWLGLRVIRENGYPIRAVDAVVRNLVRIVDALPSGYAIGLLVMLFNARSKRLGDFAAGTIVVREDAWGAGTTLTALTSGFEPALVRVDAANGVDGTGRAESAGDGESAGRVDGDGSGDFRLPPLRAEHATLVRDFLMRRGTMAPAARRRLAARLADTVASRYGLESLLQAEEDERFLERFR